MSKIAIFPGSFDPFTKGHEDIVLRGLNMFDKVIIAIGYNSSKSRHFDVETVKTKIQQHFANKKQIETVIYNELTAEFAKKCNAGFLLRGLRNTTDFEYENSISQVNRDLNKDLETVFLITSKEYAAISSSIVREVHKYGGDVSKYLPFSI